MQEAFIWFLLEENGPVAHIELDCLKRQVGNDCTLEGYPVKETDPYMFKIEDVFAFTLPGLEFSWFKLSQGIL